MTTLTATYRVVTPMFLGGADPPGPPELRAASFKGCLRFWWRAIVWNRIRSACHDEVTAIATLSKAEDRLFGSTRTGQSSVLMDIKWSQPPGTVADWPPNGPPVGSTYLGFGITQSREKPHRTGFVEKSGGLDTVFTVSARCKNSLSQDDVKDIEAAFFAFGLLGGLGSRSRRAFGSIAIESINDKDCRCADTAVYEIKIRELIRISGGKTPPLPPFTAFSCHSCMAIDSQLASTAKEAHKRLGDLYRGHRGQPSKLRGRVKRAFGLPLQNVDVERRRASPLLLHVHPIGARFVGLVLFLPAKFHPDIVEGDRPEFFKDVRAFLNSPFRLVTL